MAKEALSEGDFHMALSRDPTPESKSVFKDQKHFMSPKKEYWPTKHHDHAKKKKSEKTE